jgi:nucleoside-diphosphate-sugar epimerase
MRILIIGGTGFIGPQVVRRLVEQGHAVTLFHRGRTQADLPRSVVHLHGERAQLPAYRDELKQLSPEVVLDTRPFTEAEGRATMQALRGIARRVVALSSGDVYRAYDVLRCTEPGPPDNGPLGEEAPLRQQLYPYRGPTPRQPDDPMRWADDYEKILVERTVLGDPSLPGTILRLPMVYGPGDDHHRLFPYLKRMDDGRPAILLDELQAAWRWTRGYVVDVATAIVAAVLDDRAAGRIYNVGEAEALSEADWVRAIGRAAGWAGSVVLLPEGWSLGRRPKLCFEQHLVMDSTRIRRELGYREVENRAEALVRTVAWERAHLPPRIDPQEFNYVTEDAALLLGQKRS